MIRRTSIFYKQSAIKKTATSMIIATTNLSKIVGFHQTIKIKKQSPARLRVAEQETKAAALL